MLKIRKLVSKANISNISEISFSWKLLALTVFTVSVTQLQLRKGTRYGLNLMCPIVLKSKPKFEHDKKIFFRLRVHWRR